MGRVGGSCQRLTQKRTSHRMSQTGRDTCGVVLYQGKKDKAPAHLANFSFHVMKPLKAVKTEGKVTSGLQKTGQSCHLLTGAHCFNPNSIHI